MRPFSLVTQTPDKMLYGELQTSIFRQYNDCVAEFFQTSRNRLKGIVIINFGSHVRA